MTFNESKTRAAIQSLEVLAGHPSVALKLIELSHDPEAEVDDYARWIATDVSLTSRVLSIVNSAWYSPATPITTVQGAICMLGLGQVRVIALSHCVASLHQSMALRPEDARVLWCGSMCKAIAARKIAESLDLELTDEWYISGLLQDIGLSLFQSLDAQTLNTIHRSADLGVQATLDAEREHFGLDHQACGELIARKLDLPVDCMRAIARHHTGEKHEYGQTLPNRGASALPHDGKTWCTFELEKLECVIEELGRPWSNAQEFIGEVEAEFAELDELLGHQASDHGTLLESLIYASQQNAQAASTTVSQNIWLREGKTSLHEQLNIAERAHLEAEQRADHDPLTQLFNRDGWDRRARVSLRRSSQSTGTGLAFFDLDHFKELNDEHGHVVGDQFLVEISRRLKSAVRADDIVCRWGGDEFVVLFCGGEAGSCLEAATRVQEHMCSANIAIHDVLLPVSVTVGFVSLAPESATPNLGDLLQIADEQLYKAKGTQRGTLSSTHFRVA